MDWRLFCLKLILLGAQQIMLHSCLSCSRLAVQGCLQACCLLLSCLLLKISFVINVLKFLSNFGGLGTLKLISVCLLCLFC